MIDLLRERKGPPAGIVTEYAALLKGYGIAACAATSTPGEWPAQEFKRHGITYEAAGKPKSDLYVDALALLNSVGASNFRPIRSCCTSSSGWSGALHALDATPSTMHRADTMTAQRVAGLIATRRRDLDLHA